ncbi:hypothetical protein SAMN05660420_02708 [Desulfuromusa kysingii]|uniref:Uncharacterized protein n=1 Tax=Desulfuromusa kysingii TaxID=37625 RepID=A0A1H4CWR5_9BACT|nr:hypothetical protein SAMN05660420_02708 [Desulfuromusa kysingii]
MSQGENDQQDGRNMMMVQKYVSSVLGGQSDVAAPYAGRV